jgi:hypothetical protein
VNSTTAPRHAHEAMKTTVSGTISVAAKRAAEPAGTFFMTQAQSGSSA